MTALLLAALSFLDQILGGSLGGAILVLSLGVRIGLLPLTIRMARRAQRNQAIARAIQPEIDEIKRRYAKKPERLFEETKAVYKKHNVSPFDGQTLLGGFVQWPVFAILYGAIKRSLTSRRTFLWVKNLSAPDVILTFVILTLTAFTAYLMPSASEQARAMIITLQVVVTAFIVWKLAAGLGLYWLASNLVSLFQVIWLKRDPRGAGASA